MNVSFLNNKLSSQFAYIVARGTSRFKFSDTSRHDTSPMACRYTRAYSQCFGEKVIMSIILWLAITSSVVYGQAIIVSGNIGSTIPISSFSKEYRSNSIFGFDVGYKFHHRFSATVGFEATELYEKKNKYYAVPPYDQYVYYRGNGGSVSNQHVILKLKYSPTDKKINPLVEVGAGLHRSEFKIKRLSRSGYAKKAEVHPIIMFSTGLECTIITTLQIALNTSYFFSPLKNNTVNFNENPLCDGFRCAFLGFDQNYPYKPNYNYTILVIDLSLNYFFRL